MLRVTFRRVQLKKLHPLTISRGVSTGSENLFVSVTDGTHTGIGEGAPGAGYDGSLAERAEDQISTIDLTGRSPHEVWNIAREAAIEPPGIAALDTALWDLLAKQAGLPLYKLLGLPRPSVKTSVTSGINPPDIVRERVQDILGRTGAKSLKIKLGSPEGIEADKANFCAARETAEPFRVRLRVDANGGWSVSDARHMMQWLADRGVDYVEQPLVEGGEDGLIELFHNRPLPFFIDESCRVSADVVRWRDRVDGINLKLMKCGGLTEALRLVATARACGLKTMIGCMGETSVALAAGASIGALFDHIDLDSHFNLDPDPADGLLWVNGVVMPRDVPGHGAYLKDA